MRELLSSPRRWRPVTGLVVAVALLASLPATSVAQSAPEAPTTQDVRVAMSDGVELEVRLAARGAGFDDLSPRPVIVEFTPYNETCCVEVAGPEFAYVKVHIRGTGASAGSFDALGPRTQQDVAEVLDWVCDQPWSNGRTGLVGFSASAITIYNSLHLELPCVETAVLMSGTFELYRDLLYPGGIPNAAPALAVLLGIGGPALSTTPERMSTDPLSLLDLVDGNLGILADYLAHPTLDDFWRERGFRGDVNDLPILMVAGFFDVESRGAFQAFQELRDDGAHLLVVGAHDGVPAGSGGHDEARSRWFDRYLRDVDNGIDREPTVRLFLADGDREDHLAGQFVRHDATDWPVPGTTWRPLYLDGARSGTATSVNDGTLAPTPGAEATATYAAVPSVPWATDPYTTSTVGVFNDVPTFTDMTQAEPLGLSWTTDPLTEDLWSAGPASLELVLSSTSPSTDLYAVLSDVDESGVAHPMAAGRLRTTYPGIDRDRSLIDGDGEVVQPYGTYDQPDPAAVGEERRYHVELWPIGNRFRAGHRIRLHVVGVSAYHLPGVPAVNTIRLGEGQSRLLLPELPVPPEGDPAPAGADDEVAAPAPAPVSPDPDLGPAPQRAAPLPTTGGSGGPAAVALLLLVGAVRVRPRTTPVA